MNMELAAVRRPSFMIGIALCSALFSSAVMARPAHAACANEALRIGASVALPDCRAYELVTPANTGGSRPVAANFTDTKGGFDSALVSTGADSVIFNAIGGALPNTPGTGRTDRYEATRGPAGWISNLIGPTSSQAEFNFPGGIDSTHSYGFFEVDGQGGSLVEAFGVETEPFAGKEASLLWGPAGQFTPLGEGPLGVENLSCGDYIAPDGEHIIFESGYQVCNGNHLTPPPVRLREDSPPPEVHAVYDRTPSGLHTVSLLPGDVTPTTDSAFEGSSVDGSVTLFVNPTATPIEIGVPPIENGAILYARLNDAETVEVANSEAGTVTPAGVSQNGEYVFYMQNGNIYAFDPVADEHTTIVESEDAELVNISADGSHVYFVSHKQLDGSNGKLGAPNLYVWTRSTETTRFIAVVSEGDLSGGAGEPFLTDWTAGPAAALKAQFIGGASEASRTNPTGTALAFESRGELTSYENDGHVEVYLYQAEPESLICLSCNPNVKPAAANASLQSIRPNGGDTSTTVPLTAIYPTANVTNDGKMVLFQSEESLVPMDNDGLQDVYEWKDGSLFLISSGQSQQNDYLYANTTTGSDVLFLTGDGLVPRDENGGNGAIYDARVGGGFAESSSSTGCSGEACQGPPSVIPGLSTPASSTFTGAGNVRHHRKHHRHRKHRRHHKHRKRYHRPEGDRNQARRYGNLREGM